MHCVLQSDTAFSLSRQNLFALQDQGPVVQSIVSLTSSLRGQLVKCFMTLLPNTLIFLLKKCEKLLHCKSFSHFPTKNIGKFKILTFEILTKR